jgi:DNA gyrase/topoisomerase IV subunit A
MKTAEQPSNYVLKVSREYALYICRQRAIPNVTDGLKHVQRIALWILKDRAEKIKTVALSGLCAYRKFYVHGDTSCNAAIGLLAAPYCNNVPLIEGHGAFGSRIAPVEGIGSARYTSVSRSKAAQAFLYADLDLVPTEDNYDLSDQQPVHFLPLIPTVLLNGISGIAVGWSTNILPHNLKDIIVATKNALADKPIDPLFPHYERYDLTIKRLASGQWELTGKVKILDSSTLEIHELPPGLNIETFRKRLIALEETDQIVSYTDRSTDAIAITIKMKRGSIADWTADQAIEFFKLRERVTERLVVVGWDGESIQTYESPEILIKDFVAWRLSWYTTRFEKLHNDSSYELNYWLALEALFAANFPAQLGKFANRRELQDRVMVIVTKANVKLDDRQLDRIVNLPTYRWTIEFIDEIKKFVKNLQNAIIDYQAILQSPTRLRKVYADELDDLTRIKI